MSTVEFKPGDVVYHKANNLRMVVLSLIDDKINCRYINNQSEFAEKKFAPIEISLKRDQGISLRTKLS